MSPIFPPNYTKLHLFSAPPLYTLCAFKLVLLITSRSSARSVDDGTHKSVISVCRGGSTHHSPFKTSYDRITRFKVLAPRKHRRDRSSMGSSFIIWSMSCPFLSYTHIWISVNMHRHLFHGNVYKDDAMFAIC